MRELSIRDERRFYFNKSASLNGITLIKNEDESEDLDYATVNNSITLSRRNKRVLFNLFTSSGNKAIRNKSEVL